MNKKVFFLFLFSVLVFSEVYSQHYDNKISSIDSLISFLNRNEMDRETFFEIQSDGEVIKSKKILGLIKFTKFKGAFAETYILKDSVLVCLTVGTRIYQNRKKTESTNAIENFIFNNEKLCYYNKMKYFEEQNVSDSLLYEITYYIDNEKLLKSSSKGNLQFDTLEYLEKVISYSEEKVAYKNLLLQR